MKDILRHNHLSLNLYLSYKSKKKFHHSLQSYLQSIKDTHVILHIHLAINPPFQHSYAHFFLLS